MNVLASADFETRLGEGEVGAIFVPLLIPYVMRSTTKGTSLRCRPKKVASKRSPESAFAAVVIKVTHLAGTKVH